MSVTSPATMDTSPAPAPTERTFTKYTPAQATTYTQTRRNYHSSVYDFIITHHTSTGGELTTLLDVGCGPGLATRSLAPHFQHATGLDPSPGMIATAQSLGGTTAAPATSPINYAVSAAETLTAVPPHSVDLLTVANAAHWFASMRHFWTRAAQVLRPGGTVVIWTSGSINVHPSMPNAEKVQAAIDRHREEDLGPFMDEGNRMVQAGYRGLKMPWDCEPVVEGWEEGTFVRRVWGLEEFFFEGQEKDGQRGGVGLEAAEMMLGTGSAVTRWREANPEKVGTQDDVVKKLMREIGVLLREAGVKEGEERINGAVGGVVLLVKRKKYEEV